MPRQSSLDGVHDRYRAAYGVDDAARGARLVHAERVRGRLRFRVVEAASPAFQQAMRNGAPVAAAMPGRQSLTCWVEAPFGSRGKVLKVLPTVLDIQLPFELEDCLYTFLDLRRIDPTRHRALAVAARRQVVEERLRLLGQEGFDPIALDHEGLALWSRALAESPTAPGDDAAPRVVLFVDEDRAVMVVGEGEAYLQTHALAAVEPRLMARLLRSAWQGRVRACDWVWCGAAAARPDRLRAMQAGIDSDWVRRHAAVDDPAHCLARALAARLVSDDPLACNLRLGPLAHGGARRRQDRRVRAAGLTVLAAGLLLCAVSGFVTLRIHQTRAASQRAFTELAAALLGRPPGPARGEDAVRIVRRHVEDRRATLAPFREALQPSRTHRLRQLMTMADALDVRWASLTMRPPALTVSGVGPEWKTGESVAAQVAELGYQVDLERGDALRDATIPFTIRAGERQ